MIEPLEGTALIVRERLRQVSQEGWTPEHDDQHSYGELAKAAAVYAIVEQTNVIRILENLRSFGWPWDREWFKPFTKPSGFFPEVDRIGCLVKAGALIAAEIDRLQRLESSQSKEPKEPDEQADEMTVTVTARQLLALTCSGGVAAQRKISVSEDEMKYHETVPSEHGDYWSRYGIQRIASTTGR